MRNITDLAAQRRAIAETRINVSVAQLRKWGDRFSPLVKAAEKLFQDHPAAVHIEKPSAIGTLRIFRTSADADAADRRESTGGAS